MVPTIRHKLSAFAPLSDLFEDHARESDGGPGLRREGLIVFERPAVTSVQELNQRVKWREATDPSLVLILRDLSEKARGVQRRQPVDQHAVFGFDPFKKIRHNRLKITKLFSHVRQVNAGNKTNLTAFLRHQVLQNFNKRLHSRMLLGRRLTQHHRMKRGDEDRNDLEWLFPLALQLCFPLRDVFQKQHLKFQGVFAAMSELGAAS